jgi:ribosomal protein S27AE
MVSFRPIVVHNRCPKCGGNIYLDSDEHGWFEHCLQCGYTSDLEVTAPKYTQPSDNGG